MQLTPLNPLSIDPSQPVPEQYVVFCEHCNYSLLGLSGERCPECGTGFDPKQLPYARIPWLHRRRLGRIMAYQRTVRMIVFSPRQFAAELCRPVRLSAIDAMRFRRLTIHVAVGSVVLTAVALIVLWAWSMPPTRYPRIVTESVIGLLAVALVLELFLRLASDIPLFIWRGVPSMKPHELAPVHHYAAAPLALAPLGIPLVLLGTAAWNVANAQSQAQLTLVAAVLGAIWLLTAWLLPLVLMRAASGASRRQVALLALYLPIHWAVMGLLVLLLVGVVSFGLSYLIDVFHIRI